MDKRRKPAVVADQQVEGGRTMSDNSAAVREPGGELTIAAMDEWDRMAIGRKTYRFVRRVMQNPELKAMIQKRAAEIRAQESNT